MGSLRIDLSTVSAFQVLLLEIGGKVVLTFNCGNLDQWEPLKLCYAVFSLKRWQRKMALRVHLTCSSVLHCSYQHQRLLCPAASRVCGRSLTWKTSKPFFRLNGSPTTQYFTCF